jgi:hypothetical protein
MRIAGLDPCGYRGRHGQSIEMAMQYYASQTQMLEVINGIGISTMAAIAGNLADTPVDDRFMAQTWTAA